MCSTQWMTLIYAKKKIHILTNVKTNDSFGNFDWQKHIEQSQKTKITTISQWYT